MKVLGLIESPKGKLDNIVMAGLAVNQNTLYRFLVPDTTIKKYDEIKYVKGVKWEECEITELIGIWGLADSESNFIGITGKDKEAENELLKEIKVILDRQGNSYMELTNDIFPANTSFDHNRPSAIPKSKYEHFRRWQGYRRTKSESSIFA